MAFNFLVQLGIAVVGFVLNAALKPRHRRVKSPDFERPAADEGRPIPLGYGTFPVAPNIVWVGNITQTPSKVGTYYAANMVMTLCEGPVND